MAEHFGVTVAAIHQRLKDAAERGVIEFGGGKSRDRAIVIKHVCYEARFRDD